MNSKGLLPLPIDTRDYSHNGTFGTLGSSQLPTNDFTIYDSFKYAIVWGDTLNKIAKKFGYLISDIMSANPQIKSIDKIYTGEIIIIPERKNYFLNQLDLDFCTAFATSELQNAIWGIPVDPYYQMAKIKQISGNVSQYGASLRDAVQSVVKYGSIPLKNAPYSYPGIKDRDFLANYKNYPTGFDTIALQEKDLSFFSIDGPHDTFDNIRSTLWQHIQERRAVSFGLFWHDEWTETIGGIVQDQMPMSANGGGHNMAIIGQKTINNELYLIFQQTWGSNAGDNGFYYFPREIVDACFREGYGAFTFSNKDASGIKSVGLMTSIATFFNRLVGNI